MMHFQCLVHALIPTGRLLKQVYLLMHALCPTGPAKNGNKQQNRLIGFAAYWPVGNLAVSLFQRMHQYHVAIIRTAPSELLQWLVFGVFVALQRCSF